MEPLLQLQNITKKFTGIDALKNVNLTLQKGEIHGFLGPNGAGKTTTMRIMAGLITPTSGNVIINGQNFFDDIKKSQSFIGYLPESPPLYPHMTVREYLIFVREINSLKNTKKPLEIEHVIDNLKLHDVKNRLIGNLSKGYKQRVGLAGVLIYNPEILILDEPTVGLDPIALKELRDFIMALKGDHTILISSHILHEIDLLCSQITIINRGEIIKSGTIDEIKSSFLMKQVLTIEVASASSDKNIFEIIKQKYVTEKFEREGNTWKIYFNDERDLRSEVLKSLMNQNIEILELKKDTLRLEDVFVSIANSTHKGIHK